jgi:hypothetical protein
MFPRKPLLAGWGGPLSSVGGRHAPGVRNTATKPPGRKPKVRKLQRDPSFLSPSYHPALARLLPMDALVKTNRTRNSRAFEAQSAASGGASAPSSLLWRETC